MIKKRTKGYLNWIEANLDQVLSSEKGLPSEIHDAMRYAVLNGGKRFRPSLVLAACEAVGGNPRQALVPASAVELIHAYSLVHDDLPALDNDDIRRGKPTCHRKFGEALAILTGDALLTLAFQLLSEFRPIAKANCMIRELADAVGTRGMIGGQVADILWTRNGSAKNLDASRLDFISRNKTGRLIQVSAVIGAVVGTGSRSKIDRMRRFGSALGLAFQVVDDIMDGDGYLKLMDPTRACQKAEDLIRKAKQEAGGFGKKGDSLAGLADFLYQRARSTDVLPVGTKN